MFKFEKMPVNNEPKVVALPEEIEKAKKEGGPKAVEELQKRMERVDAMIKAKAAEKGVQSLEAEARKRESGDNKLAA